MKKYKEYVIQDVCDLTDNQGADYTRDLQKTRIFSKKGFKNYQEDNETYVVGNIRKRQKRFVAKSSAEKLSENKIAKATLFQDDDEKSFDVKENKNRHTFGYAWIGGNRFLRVTTFNPLWLLLIFLLASLLFFGGYALHQHLNYQALPIEGEKIVDEVKESGYTVLYVDINGYDGQEIKLNPKNRTVKLVHLDTENNKNFLLSYKIYNGDKLIYQTYNSKLNQISLIQPGYSVNADIYDKLPMGRSKLKYEITAYTADKFQRGNTFYQVVSVVKE